MMPPPAARISARMPPRTAWMMSVTLSPPT
jgi:hypothetical protein